jgi:hypothetical protein
MGGGISVEVKEQPMNDWREDDKEKYERLYSERAKRLLGIKNYKDAKWKVYGPLYETKKLDFVELEKRLEEAEKFITNGEKERKLRELEKFVEKVKLLPVYCYKIDRHTCEKVRTLHDEKSCKYCSTVDLYFPNVSEQLSSSSASITDIEKYKEKIAKYIKQNIHPVLKSDFFCPLSNDEIDAITDIEQIVFLHTKYMERKAKFKTWLCKQLDEFIV